jgi:protein-tyrosine phosphatase
MAGIHPEADYRTDTRRVIRGLLGLGITRFVDLTEEGELEGYDKLVRDDSRQMALHATHTRFAIPDMKTPDIGQMEDILKTIRSFIKEGHVVYVHCFAGLGRTGTVVGCYLIDNGVLRENIFDEIAGLRGRPDAPNESPITDAQRQMVLDWRS